MQSDAIFFFRNSIRFQPVRWDLIDLNDVWKARNLSTLKDNKREIEEIKKKKKQKLYLNCINPYIYLHIEIIAYRNERMTRKRTWNSASKHQFVFINREILKQNVNFEFLIQNRIISLSLVNTLKYQMKYLACTSSKKVPKARWQSLLLGRTLSSKSHIRRSTNF